MEVAMAQYVHRLLELLTGSRARELERELERASDEMKTKAREAWVEELAKSRLACIIAGLLTVFADRLIVRVRRI